MKSSVDSKTSGETILLINYITKHQLPVFEALNRHWPGLKVLISVDMEPQRDYRAEFGSLVVEKQRNWTFQRTWKHEAGFEDAIHVHVPWDTLWRLLFARPHWVISYELGVRSILSALYRKLFRKSRLVLCVNVSEHTEQSWGMVRRRVRPWLLRAADAVTYNGPSCKRYLQSIGVPEEKLFHFPYAAHPDTVYRGSTERGAEQRHRLLWVGQLTERKNPLLLIEQLSRWAERHPGERIALSLVGRGHLLDAIMAMPRPTNFQLESLGVIAPEAMPKIWSEHGVMVFPTLADEWGMVVNEALHSGLPVLGSRYAQSTLAFVEEGVTGWSFPPTDVEAMYAAIDSMMKTDVARMNRMAAEGRRRVEHRTPEFCAEAMKTVLQFVDGADRAVK